MGQIIHRLDSSVIDQIAAGEVVDRPAHMVKELCENSLDAGATEITVDFKNGGRSVLIRDNGIGIRRDDLELALARHATSKITAADDLWSVGSYGFRGEALASIAAVSEIRIQSRSAQDSVGAKIECRYGSIAPVVDSGSEVGTTITIENLYQNMPARLKFLKTDVGENTAIKNQLRALALANPQVSFRVLNDGKLLYYWPSVEDYKLRVEQVLELPEMYSGEAMLDHYRAQVIVSSPNQTLGHSKQIWLFVRGRHIQDRSLQTAVLEAYRNLLMHGEYPAAVIHLDCDPADVDVNVSPTKSQVKFREPGQAFRVVQRAVRGVLERAPWVKDLLGDKSGGVTSSMSITAPIPKTDIQKPEENFTFSDREFVRVQAPAKDLGGGFSLEAAQYVRDFLAPRPAPPVAEERTAKPESASHWSQLEVLGQAHLTYIITQKSDAILFVDQHAAHERVMFEKLMQGYRDGRCEVQDFLLPVSVRLTEEVVSEVMKAQHELERLGLSVDQSGPDEIAIRAAPAIVKSEALTPMVEKLGQELVEMGNSFQVEKLIADLVATMACHSAIRAGQALSLAEMKALLEQMDEYPLSSFCPHGRPVFVEYPIRKLERDFGRIV